MSVIKTIRGWCICHVLTVSVLCHPDGHSLIRLCCHWLQLTSQHLVSVSFATLFRYFITVVSDFDATLLTWARQPVVVGLCLAVAACSFSTVHQEIVVFSLLLCNISMWFVCLMALVIDILQLIFRWPQLDCIIVLGGKVRTLFYAAHRKGIDSVEQLGKCNDVKKLRICVSSLKNS